MAPTETVSGKFDGTAVSFLVQEATILMGQKRFRLMNEMGRKFGLKDGDKLVAPDGVDPDEFDLAVIIYPNLVATVSSASGAKSGLPWPFSFEDFKNLPEWFVRDWQSAVSHVNPHWYPKEETGKEEDPKGQTESSSD